MADSDADISPPDVDHGRGPAVVAGIHTEVIFLVKPGMKRQNPIRPLFVRSALIRPKGWRSLLTACLDGIGLIAPAMNLDRTSPLIRVFHIEHGDGREVVVDGDGYDLA